MEWFDFWFLEFQKGEADRSKGNNLRHSIDVLNT